MRFKRDNLLGIKTVLLHERDMLACLYKNERRKYVAAEQARARAVARLRSR